jgi:membrane protein DedA with SNARE-associated domain
MDQYMEPLMAFVEANHAYAGPVLALLTFGESLLVIGIIIPASVVMLVMGGLIGSGMVDPLSVLLWGIGGAAIGDSVSYVIGRWLGPTLLSSWPLNRQRRAVATAPLRFRRHGPMAVFVGRFMGPLRAVAPTVAGMLKMHQGRFQAANVASAVTWVPIMLLPGYLTGRGMQAAGGGMHFGVLLAAILSIVLAIWVIRSFMRRRRVDH